MPGRTALRVVLIAGPLLIAAAVVLVLSVGDRPLLGANRVGPAGFFAVVPGGGRLCTGGDDRFPAGTGEVGLRTSTDQDAPLEVSVVSGGRTVATGRRGGYTSGNTPVELAH